MPFNTLLLHGLVHGKSVKENGVSVTADERAGEKILIFKLDRKDKSIAKALQLSGGICDSLFLLSREASGMNGAQMHQRTLCLVELKGEDVQHATEQIINTYKHLSEMLKKDPKCLPFCRAVTWKAFICVNRRSPINMTKTSIDDLHKIFGQKKHFDVSHDGDKDFNKVLRA